MCEVYLLHVHVHCGSCTCTLWVLYVASACTCTCTCTCMYTVAPTCSSCMYMYSVLLSYMHDCTPAHMQQTGSQSMTTCDSEGLVVLSRSQEIGCRLRTSQLHDQQYNIVERLTTTKWCVCVYFRRQLVTYRRLMGTSLLHDGRHGPFHVIVVGLRRWDRQH